MRVTTPCVFQQSLLPLLSSCSIFVRCNLSNQACVTLQCRPMRLPEFWRTNLHCVWRDWGAIAPTVRERVRSITKQSSHYDEVNRRSSVLDTRTLNIISEWNPSHAITKTAFQWDSFLLHQFNSREMWSYFPPIKGQYMTCLSFIPITKWRKKNRGSGPNEPRFRRYSAIKAAICNLAIATSAMFLDAKCSFANSSSHVLNTQKRDTEFAAALANKPS